MTVAAFIASLASLSSMDKLAPSLLSDHGSDLRSLGAIAELGPGHHRLGDIAQQLGREVTSLGPTRNKLIAKGMIWSTQHGDTAFTVPLFDEFMRRIMPGDEWRLEGGG